MSSNRGLKVLLFGLVAVGLLGACSDDETAQDSTERDDEGQIEEGGEVGVFAFQEGDCLLLPDSTEAQPSYDAVPCAEAHDVQVFSLWDIDEDEFPGDQAAQQMAQEGCTGEHWDDVFDTPYLEDQTYDASALYPSEDTWDQGDREVVCVVVRLDGEQLTEDLVS